MRISIRCLLGYHDMRSISRIGYAGEHVGCCRCKRQFGMNHDVRAILPWRCVAADYASVFGYRPDPQTVAQRLDPRNWKRFDPTPKETARG